MFAINRSIWILNAPNRCCGRLRRTLLRTWIGVDPGADRGFARQAPQSEFPVIDLVNAVADGATAEPIILTQSLSVLLSSLTRD
jgi:hypothetical protein